MAHPSNDAAIDHTRRFMPEHLTPLFHTPGYAGLTEAQRLRYNQRHACYLNEQTIFFEGVMAQPILRSLLARDLPAPLRTGIETFIIEEARHSEMFRALNRRCRPVDYAHGDFHFIRPSRRAAWALRHAVQRADRLPLFLWLLLVQEERALFYAKAFLREADGLEPGFVAVQRAHLADEVGHIQCDEQLLEWIWPRTGATWRRLNARWFAWLLGEFFTTPKRSGWNVVAELVREFPDLQSRSRQLRADLSALGQNAAFHRLAYSREVTPKTFARFDRWPEFRRLSRWLPCYRPAPTADTLRAGLPVESSSAR